MNYKKYSDDDLIDIYNTTIDYSGKIEADLAAEILNRGGIDKLQKFATTENKHPNEIKKINKAIYRLCKNGATIEYIKSNISSKILSPTQLSEHIEKQVAYIKFNIADKAINARTIIGSLTGLFISTIIGSIIWAYTLMHSGYMFYILIPGMLLISYFIIRLLTGQSKNNWLVFIATFFSVFFSIVIAIGYALATRG
ncbi:MAG TPA: hypothetical protein VN698_16575 [Bacteroidia bacterium]|nr:hypothetical protein [Bacteroidia bacterium]